MSDATIKQRVYLDTSVLSAIHDSGTPGRQQETTRFWARRDSFVVTTSEVTQFEINQTPDTARRTTMLESLKSVHLFPLTDEMRHLAQRYIDQGVFTGRMENDAKHVAAAVVSRCDVLLSWNFKHLVNRTRRAAINIVNQAARLPTIEIIVPPEI